MTTTPDTNLIDLRSTGPSAIAEAAQRAAEALASGRLVVFPTETVYGIAASAADEGATRQIAEAVVSASPPRPSAWHAHSASLVRDIVQSRHPVHRRLMTRLLPGPVTFQIEMPAEDLERIRVQARAVPGSIHDGTAVSIRVPDDPVARAVLEAAWSLGHPVIAYSIASAGLGDGSRLTDAVRRSSLPALVIDAGPTRFGRPSTTVRLTAAGGYRLVSQGALESRMIDKQLERTVLFVCTGNTCRSPMAEAVARHLLSKARPGGITTKVLSAGTSADEGAAATPEAITALSVMDIDPAPLKAHRSRELTRQMLADAEVVFAMTGSHARAARAVDPSAAHKVMVLDPDGQDIQDPIGGSQEVYTRTAQRLLETIKRRLAEMDEPHAHRDER